MSWKHWQKHSSDEPRQCAILPFIHSLNSKSCIHSIYFRCEIANEKIIVKHRRTNGSRGMGKVREISVETYEFSGASYRLLILCKQNKHTHTSGVIIIISARDQGTLPLASQLEYNGVDTSQLTPVHIARCISFQEIAQQFSVHDEMAECKRQLRSITQQIVIINGIRIVAIFIRLTYLNREGRKERNTKLHLMVSTAQLY